MKHALAQLDELLHAQAPADTIAAMIVEPVLGEGGYRPAAPEFLSGLRDRCDEHGILLVFDEVQTGVGRTGAFAAYQRYGVTPDVLLLAKGIANGLPLGAIVASRELMARWPTMAHGTTFGGNPVSCAAASAVLDVIERDGIAARAARLGEEIVARLRNVTATNRTVVDVRGLGMMVGVELASADAAHAVADRCLADGLLVLTCGVQGNVLRLIPPLTIGHDELALGLDILGRALAAVAVAV